ncbi:aminotransferase in exopolysaccharide biosynthesis [Chitinophaga dinghuensis]|uniref:Aminotransferase in exopolysaccharide biosynthesis n=1 Tax=Chitinophaga dinghuensis TaxID=1539050 RepID=A0A327W707_9BACT|nr:LegC family aminotransferase [Chitinophaga dinghuensis]RAJ85800.1 aminotransferase in exopolysaccharide biosynthesis [Chitinophaga dinghuensis]
METGKIISFIREVFNEPEGFIPLHAPFFGGNEKKYVLDTIESTYVSSVGAYVNKFEEEICAITGAKFAIATVNGTTALHLALKAVGVSYGEEVITQPLTFVATANAIVHAGAIPVFVDVDIDTLGLSPDALQAFLQKNATLNADGVCINKSTGRRISACLPMHTFGFPVRIAEIAAICKEYHIPLVEDAAESLGSYYHGKHTGMYGDIAAISFNGNKTVTSGGGGVVITNDEKLGKWAKHISTTAKIPHQWEFMHDEVGYNYRMPNLNAALAVAQLEQLPYILENKRQLADLYSDFFENSNIRFVQKREDTIPNFWLNTIIFEDKQQQQQFLEMSNQNKVMTRPIWTLMNRLPMYKDCQRDELRNAVWLEERVVNIPSSVRVG